MVVGEEKEGNDTDKKMCYLSLCLRSSLTRPHGGKYNDHRKVISKLSQSEDSEPTENQKKKHRDRRRQRELWFNCSPVCMFTEMNIFLMRA